MKNLPFAFLDSKKEWGIVLGILCIVFAMSFLWKFYVFYQYINADKQTIQARVIHQYYKKDKWVLKLKTQNNLILYTTSKEDLKNLQDKEVRIFGKPAKCTFFQSLQSCFFISFSMDLLPQDYKNNIYSFVQSQHSDDKVARLYQTLFFATSLPKEWRDFANALNISHLLAISGLHLGILLGVLYICFSPFYTAMQKRYFTYRNRFFDLGILCHLFLLAYLYFLDFPPAFLRAYVMSLLGLCFLFFHLSLMNFSFLFLCACLILALFPYLVFSVGFWFSLCGVFYIFLFFKYFTLVKTKNKIINGIFIAIFLNLALFFQMMPIVHFIFPKFSLYAFLSIPLSIVFAPIFIVMIVTHFLGIGGIFDSFLLQILDFFPKSIEVFTPLWALILYLVISLFAIRNLWFYYLSLAFGGIFCIFLVAKTL